MRTFRNILAVVVLTAGSVATADTGTLNLYGVTGLIDMPTGESQPDAQLSMTLGNFAGTNRTTLTFQITPRLSGSFRYTAIQNCNCFGFDTYYDRSFDLHYQLAFEGRYRPAIAVGLRDFVGTGQYSSEYIVATKRLTPTLKVTGGIGWGRLGSYNSFANPLASFSASFNTRSTGFGLGGVPTFDHWFRGPAALFGGLEWQTPIRRLSLKAEYSSDAYTFEAGAPSTVAPRSPLFAKRSPFNFGLDYQVNRSTRLSAYYLYGSTVGLRATLALNPRRSPVGGSLENAPVPIYRRPRDGELQAELRTDTSWLQQPDGRKILLGNLQTALADDGYVIESLSATGTTAEVRLRNKTFGSTAQIIGRAARVMSRIMPVSINVFVITVLVDGVPVVSATLQRRDLEDFENDPDGVAKSYASTQLANATRLRGAAARNPDVYPNLSWSIGPYVRPSFFDPSNPVRLDAGIRAKGKIEVTPGFSLSGSVIKKLAGNLNAITRVSNSVLPHVRSDFGLYDIAGDPAIEYLTADYLFKLSPNIFGRVSAGYLERMFGGVSGEVLWKPVNSNFALGLEANLVRIRDFDLLFGFRSYQVATGHVSAYWDIPNGFTAQVDVGRYLAGDVGATVSLDRRFNNGWKVGAFFTLTDVPFASFGEGSFDKGFRLTVPLSWITGRPSQKSSTSVIRPITRDGGARLKIRNRLYPMVNSHHSATVGPTWGRFWR